MSQNMIVMLTKRVNELEHQVELLTRFLKESIEIRLQSEMTDNEELINRMLP